MYTKRYSYDEEYIYGHSRRHAFFSSLGVAAIYSLLFACLVLGSALLVRRSIVSAHDAMVIAELYRLSAVDIILNFISFFFVKYGCIRIGDIIPKVQILEILVNIYRRRRDIFRFI